MSTTAQAIANLLEALHVRLQQAARLAAEAHLAMADDEQNLAVGTILTFEHTLPECEALFRTILLLHRNRSPEVLS